MAESLTFAKAIGFEVVAFVARRHASQEIFDGESFRDWATVAEIEFFESDHPEEACADNVFSNPEDSLALCFGPAWVFPDQVVESYPRGMFNFNGIPIPRYLGGAHFTWQVLNNSRESGRFIQRIGDRIDQGEILTGETRELSANLTTPADYFQENHTLNSKFVQFFLQKLQQQKSFVVADFNSVNNERIYFPRLSTRKNGWIDWSWTGPEVQSFCNAFADPYEGASTHYRGAIIQLHRTYFHESSINDFHPFCFGLVVRVSSDSFFVSVRGGLLEVSDWSFPESDLTILEGERLATDPNTLFNAHRNFPRSKDLD